MGECGYSFDYETVSLDDFGVEISGAETLQQLAEQYVEEGLFGEIPELLTCYIDYDAIARDLSFDYSEAQIAGEKFIYRCF